MSNIKELIREKIGAFYTEYKAKFHQNGDSYHLGIIDGLDMAERILDTLPDEPVTDCYDLKNVSEDLEEAARDFVGFDMDRDELYEYEIGIAAFKAGAEWGAEHLAGVRKMIEPEKKEGE